MRAYHIAIALFLVVLGLVVGRWLAPDCPEVSVHTDTIINTGGEDGLYCVTAILWMKEYDAFVDQTYADSGEAREVFDLLSVHSTNHRQKFTHGGWTFRGYEMRAVKFNPEVTP